MDLKVGMLYTNRGDRKGKHSITFHFNHFPFFSSNPRINIIEHPNLNKTSPQQKQQEIFLLVPV